MSPLDRVDSIFVTKNENFDFFFFNDSFWLPDYVLFTFVIFLKKIFERHRAQELLLIVSGVALV